MKFPKSGACLPWLLAAMLCALPACAATNPPDEQRVIEQTIGVSWDPEKKAQVSLDGAAPVTLATDTVFAAKRSIHVVARSLNPLTTSVSASLKAVDDPNFAALAEFFKAAQGVTDLVMPKADPAKVSALFGARAVKECTAPDRDIQALLTALKYEGSDKYPEYLRKEAGEWAKAIQDGFAASQPGWNAVTAGVDRMKVTADAVETDVNAAKAAWKTIFACSQGADTAAADKATYLAAVLTNQDMRIDQLDRTRAAIVKLRTSLSEGFTNPNKWTGPKQQDYVVQEVTPTRDKMQEVTVNLASMSIKQVAGDFSWAAKELGTAKFTVQRYSPYVIEKSVGAVFGVLKQPTYGTETKDGKTVVARTADKSLSVNPAIMLNFVCRCLGGLPMLQIGAATSKDLPAFLFGGGIRLFGLGKGDFGITYGGMMGWYKDLSKLQVGSPITGTKDIESDLAFIGKPHIKSYFSIQYKF